MKTERTFGTSKGSVKVGLFEGGVGWSLQTNTPNLFAWGLRGRKIDRLPELEQIKLNESYLKWCAVAGCGSCELRDTTCSGLQPKPFEYPVEGQSGTVTVNHYNADFLPGSHEDKTYDEIKQMLKKDARCEPIEWS